MKILIIEDEPTLANGISQYLMSENNVCIVVSNYQDALMKISVYEYDCILVDLTLPDGHGLDIISELKNLQSNAGIIIISAKNAIDDKITGLEIGADDYLPKPFHLSELNARIKAVVRRRGFDGSKTLQLDEIKVILDENQLLIHDKAISLTRSEYRLLMYFLSNQNRVLTKESIAEHLVGDDADMMNSFDFIYSHIKNLRKKMLNAGATDRLKAVYGIGYKFVNK